MILQLCLSTGLAIIISALCSIFEAALYSLPAGHIELMRKKHKNAGRTLLKLKEDIHRPITAILTLNTIANTAGASIAGAAAAGVFGDENMVWFSAAFTMTILLFSEIIPKTLGVAYCKQLAPWIAYPLHGMVKLLSPLVWLIQALIKLLPARADALLVSGEEIQAIARQSQKSGEITLQERMVITNILDLKNKNVRQVMTPLPVCFMVDAGTTLSESMELKERMNMHSRMPVYDGQKDNVIGMVLRKDILNEIALGNQNKKVRKLMHSVHFVPETARLASILLEFFKCRKHLFVVVDEYGSVTGVVSLEDVVEEIVGQEIIDESDEATDMRELAKRKRQALLGRLKNNSKVENK